jgi:outer membrane protein OmpA-like peptidoglycan-associated protein
VQAQTDEDMEAWRRSIVVMNLAHINSDKDDYSPAFFEDGIVYPSSRRKNGPIDKVTGDTYHDLYFAPILSKGILAKTTAFSLELNSALSEGPLTFDVSQKTVYFSRNDTDNGSVKIFEAKKGNLDWEEVKELSFNNGQFSYMHPSLSPAKERLYFASDMTGGFGATDIYYVEWTGSTWSRPVNLGPEVNTVGKEAFPFLHESGVLFFASDGHAGYGNYDIFMINLGDAQERIVNLGSPFNSPNDDFGFILSKEGNSGYFSSNRPGGVGKDDIYGFQALQGIPIINESFLQLYTLQVMDANSNTPVPLANVRVFEKNGENWEEELYDYNYIKDKNGKFIQQKQLKREESIQKTAHLTDRRGEVIQELQAEKEYLVLITKAGYQTKELLYSSKGKLEGERVTITLNPITCFDLQGTVKNGASKPLANTNVTIRNACDNKDYQVFTNSEGVFFYCLEIGCDFLIVADKTGYELVETQLSTRGIRGTRSMTVDLVLKEGIENEVFNVPIKTGTVLVLENIYYSFDAFSIQEGAAKELDALASMMQQYPSMEVELVAHTDARGTTIYNLELSQKRAQSAKQYLVDKGIAHQRIQTFGFGESKIRNHCLEGVNCDEEEHGFNRRTEVKVTKIDAPIEFQQRNR